MSSAIVRPLLHTIHLLTFGVLFVTGLLLFLPDLRAAVTGGYSLSIRIAHRWGGVAFVVLPVAVALRFGVRNVFAVPSAWTLRALWQGFHVAVTLLVGIAFSVTGFLLWSTRAVPESIADASHAVHDWLTYFAALLVAVHLFEVGIAALVDRLRATTATAEM